MNNSKRKFLRSVGLAALSAPVLGCISAPNAQSERHTQQKPNVAESSLELLPLVSGLDGITVAERQARVAKAQRLMDQLGVSALILEPGSAMLYFSGIRWWRSERLTAVIIPASGNIAVVTPFFEEPSVRESMTFGDEVRTWHEHENPFDKVQQILADRGLSTGVIALEDTVRYFVADGLKASLPKFRLASATPVTRGCRMYKSTHELSLMRHANLITMRAYEFVYRRIEHGMNGNQIKAIMNKAQTQLGGSNAWSLALVGPASAYPHGTGHQQPVASGDIVLMDCGCSYQGYQSDISRTFVFGKPNAKQRAVWQQVRRGQQIAFEAASLGTPAGAVDDAVRSWYEKIGYGPGYKTPGLSHRTGHGIGMDGHEPVNFVHGETELLAPGMCFSNEPGIYIFDEFGVRLEDCLYMTDSGPKWFTVPPDSMDDPLGSMGVDI